MSDQNPNQTLDTGNGILTGTDPVEPPRNSSWSQVPVGANGNDNGTTLTQGQPAPAAHTSRMFTADEVEAVRREEKDKLYGRIDTMDAELKELRKEREARAKEQKAQAAAEAEAARREDEEKLDLRQLLDRRDQEWRERFSSLEQERERDKAVFEQERRLQGIDEYRRNRLEQMAGEIAPQLRDLVMGSSEAEVDASIARMIEKTQQIMAEIAGAIPPAVPPPLPQGVSATAPPVGPLEQVSSQQSFSPDDIRNMNIDTYRKYRDGLLNAASRQYRGQG